MSPRILRFPMLTLLSASNSAAVIKLDGTILIGPR
ncbi:hypothetical protein LINGRAHAP2_LOCUS11011 [Linum grandiflorum]